MKELHNYREKLQQRSITPSESSWEQLSKKLDAHENLQKKEKWGFLKYVAIILVLISVGFYFFQPKTKIISEEKMVSPVLKENKKTAPEISLKPSVLIADTEEVSPKIQKKTEPKTEKPKIEIIENEIVFENEISETEITSESMNEDEVKVTLNSDVTDAEIEELLLNAKINIKINRANLSKQGVSAQTLLVEVEDDLHKDFKEKLVETIVATLKTPRKIVITDRGN